jgi:hypothetical protein
MGLSMLMAQKCDMRGDFPESEKNKCFFLTSCLLAYYPYWSQDNIRPDNDFIHQNVPMMQSVTVVMLTFKMIHILVICHNIVII